MIAVFFQNGFIGAVNHYAKSNDIDKAVRLSAKFVFNTLRYQVVKYLGLFNLCYKHSVSQETKVPIDEISGLDSIMMKMEYNASTAFGRKASDAGASFKVIDYYDNIYINPNSLAYENLDDYEKSNADKIREIVIS